MIVPERSNTTDRASRLTSILEMARVMIADVGIDGLNMRDLAAAAGSSLRTLYMSFGSKDQLLAMVVADSFENIIDIEAQPQSSQQSGVLNTIRLMQSLRRIAIDKAAYTQIFMGIYYKHDTDREVPELLYGMMYDRMAFCVDQLIDRSSLPDKAIKLLKEEATDRIFSIVMKWTQKTIPDEVFADRLVYSTLSCLRDHVLPSLTGEIDHAMTAALERLARD